MSGRWAGPAWGQPSSAAGDVPPLRSFATAATASYRAEGGRSDGYLVLGSSVGGVSHRLARRRCEDFFAWVQPEPGRLALVIADGVGSAGRGGEGAELAVNAACRYLLDGPRGWGVIECSRSIAEANTVLERAGGAAASELATTIVVALLEREEGSAKMALGRVGDSSAFSLSTTGDWRELFPPAGGEASQEGGAGLLAGATPVLPLGEALKRVKREERTDPGSLPDFAGAVGTVSKHDIELISTDAVELVCGELSLGVALVLVTDGVAEPLRDGPATVAPELAHVLMSAPAAELTPLELARAADFSRRGAHDDRTVLAAWLTDGEPTQTN